MGGDSLVRFGLPYMKTVFLSDPKTQVMDMRDTFIVRVT